MSKIALYLLGQPRLEVDGNPVDMNTRKAIALLAYLAVTGQSHSRESLDALLWPESTPKNARAALRTTLSVLRRALNDRWLVADRESVSLDEKADVWIDVVQFRQLMADQDTDDCANQLEPLRQAANLYQGDFMAGFSLRDSASFDEWQFFEAETLRQELATVLEQLVDCLKKEGDYEAAITHGRRWLSLDPLQEAAHRQLMALYDSSGQHNAALRQYQECVRILKEELGVPPQEETTAFYQQLRRGEKGAEQLIGNHLIANRYTCRRRAGDLLGQGSMGQVYRETDTQTGQIVAIKILKPHLVAHQPDLVKRFAREGEALRQLNHPNIIKLLAAIEEDGQPYLVMEYAAGGSLRNLLQREAPLPLKRVLQIAIELSDALTQTHYRNIIHRDLKPGNTLLDEDGTPRLTDFGVAHLAQAERLTQTGIAIGTLDYLAPEVLSGEPVDTRCDIWSLGVLLFEMLAQRRPYPGHTATEVLTAILTQPIPDLMAVRPDLPPALVSLVSQMLVKDPAQRIASARLVGAALEVIIHGRTGPSTAGSTTEQQATDVDVADLLQYSDVLTPQHNLPAQTTPFIGRETELADLAHLLADPEVRLLTILGPGGMGKTRLALESAATQADNYQHGVCFVPLAPLNNPVMVVSAIAEAVDFPFQSDQRSPQQQLLDYFREKELLLILDNFEQLVEGAQLITDVLQAALQVRVLVTSRERLRLGSEVIYSLEGLDLPKEESNVHQSNAVALFLQGAKRVKPEFAPDEVAMDAISQICRLVGGMPLGILLAAAWIEVLSPKEIATEISQSLDFLETDLRDMPDRQRSIRAVCDYSWRMLGDEEQRVFRQLSVFRGGFTTEAAQTVTGASPRILMGLVSKSFLNRNASSRFEIHELLRQYGTEQLGQSPDEETTARITHSRYFASFMQDQENELKGAGQQAALGKIELDVDNILLAWRWATERRHSELLDRMLESLGIYFDWQGQLQIGEAVYEAAARQLSVDSDSNSLRVLARLQTWRGRFLHRLGQTELATQLFQTSLNLLENPLLIDQDVRLEKASVLLEISESLIEIDPDKSFELCNQSLLLCQEMVDRWRLARNLEMLGEINWRASQSREAINYYQESLAIYRELDDQRGIARILASLGSGYHLEWRLAEGEEFVKESLKILYDIGDRANLIDSLMVYGYLLALHGEFSKSQKIITDSITLAKELGYQERLAGLQVWLAFAEIHQGKYEQVQARLKENLELCRTINQHLAEADTLVMLSKVALATKNYREAENWANESIDFLQEIGWQTISIALACKASVQISVGQGQAATEGLARGLQFGIDVPSYLSLLYGIPFYTLILLSQGELERAIELYSLAANDPFVGNSRWFRDVVGQDVEAAADTLSPGVVAAAQARGRSRNLRETTQELLTELRAAEAASSPFSDPSASLHNLPAQTTPFIGRETELADLAHLLADPEVRLLTILGPGGMGKTRLALEVAAEAVNYQHGVYFVPLAPLNDPEMVVSAIAEAVKFSFLSDQRSPKQQLLDYFREKQLLLVLDNFEHLLPAADLVNELLQTAPQLQILVTSREQLRLSGEAVFALTGLKAPNTTTNQEPEAEAVRLFLQSVRQLQPDYQPQSEDWPAINQICQLVGGMPLGILLAAGWIELLTPAEIAAEISQSLDFLESDLRDLPERQRSLRAVCEQTWRRLNEAEQDAFKRLSVFRGGFTRQAAQPVTDASLKTLTGLVKKSLLQQSAKDRYDLHEFLHQFSAEKLAEIPHEYEATQDRHRDYYLTFIRDRESKLSGGQQQKTLTEIGAEIENIRAAWDRSIEQNMIDQVEWAMQGLYRYYWIRSQFDEGQRAFANAIKKLTLDLEAADSQLLWAKLMARQGIFEAYLNKFKPAEDLLRESLAIARKLNSQHDIAFILNRLADPTIKQINHLEAKKLSQEALNISRALEDQDEILLSLEYLIGATYDLGHYEEARQFAQEGLDLSRKRNDQNFTASFLDQLGWIAFLTDDFEQSRHYYQESVAIFTELGNLYRKQLALNGLVQLAWIRGGPALAEAKSLLEERLTDCRDIGNFLHVASTSCELSLLLNDQGQYQEAITYASEVLFRVKELGLGSVWDLEANLLSSLGMAECGLGNFQAARANLYKALTVQYDNLRGIIHAAYLLAKESFEADLEDSTNQPKRALAIQLLTLVLRQPAIRQIEKNLAMPLLDQLEAELPPDVISAAQRRAQEQDLQEAVAELLEVLANKK